MTITIKDNGEVKGSTTGVNVVYFFAILFLITGGLIALTGNLVGVILVIFAIIMWYMGKLIISRRKVRNLMNTIKTISAISVHVQIVIPHQGEQINTALNVVHSKELK